MRTVRYQGQSRGWGPWRRDWLSYCSRHRVACQDCRTCMGGQYSFRWVRALSGVCFFLAPRLWRWWVNRPKSRARRQIEAAFPKLRGKEPPQAPAEETRS